MKIDLLPTPLELIDSLQPTGLGDKVMTYLSTDPLPRGIIESLNVILLGYIGSSKTPSIDRHQGF